MECSDGDGVLAAGTEDFNLRIECVEGDAHVGGVRGDAGVWSACAVIGLAEDGVVAVVAGESTAAASGCTLVAGREGGVHEVRAACALHKVAGGGGHVAKLRAGSGEKGVGEQRVVG